MAQQERRESLAVTDDVRAVETRRRLIAAFRTAVGEGRTDLSVTAFCRMAGVARSTFYTHFATMEDVAVAAVSEVFADIETVDSSRRSDHVLSRPEITRLGLRGIIDGLSDARSLVRYAIAIGSKAAVHAKLVDEVAVVARGTVLSELPHLDETGVRTLALYMAAGTVFVTLDWIEHPSMTEEQLTEYLLASFPAWLTRS
ncbi:TetR/AcrR family transcriptional regulator [Cryptosporangium phraense]|uniref:TetR/AcrR family transcriptional regulator n=1 Tax=Cryptosporangium phraense TaxID=2593070 RepID=A0A545AEK1_9ACTN|nr:TetR/AcrR family transcriptional regulator [Cryptosporangium phraense]TQS39768.1 TetR/AcrR family transcriptional regulator [Cryptosporangium phraense]